jgi:Aminoglycoside-2''-adenylyltransferase
MPPALATCNLLMVDMERARRHLGLIFDVTATAPGQGVELWLRGGWAMDFFLGRVTRDHHDIDWFAWATDAPVITVQLLDHGFRLGRLTAGPAAADHMLAAYLSAHRTMINGSALCAAPAVTERD